MTSIPSDVDLDLVLGAAQGYEWEELKPFVESLWATGFSGELRLFVSDISPRTIHELTNAGVEVTFPRRLRLRVGSHLFEPFAPPTTWLRRHLQPRYRRVVRTCALVSSDRRRATNNIMAAISNVGVARYFWYLDYLSRTLGRYRNVMLTDVRDVAFVGRPFDFAVGDSAYFFLEDSQVRLNQQLHNVRWLVTAYGPDALVEIGGDRICCAGTTIGAASAVSGYLETMVDQLGQLMWQNIGVDQAVHNYVLRKGLVSNARLIANGDGAVLTVGIMSADDALMLLEERKAVVKVVHQYDRHPAVAAAIPALGRGNSEMRTTQT